MAQAKGIRIRQYLDDWLLRAPSPETCLQHTQTLLALCQQLGWVVNMKKSELMLQRAFNFVGYRFDLLTGQVLPIQDQWTALQEKLKFIKHRKSCQTHVFDRTAHSNGETGVVGPTSHEAHPMALEATLACPRDFGKDHSGSLFTPSTPRLVVGRKQCTTGPTFAPPSTRCSVVYRHIKRRLGRTLRGLHCKRRLVSHRKSPPHKFLGVKSSPSGPPEIRLFLFPPLAAGGRYKKKTVGVEREYPDKYNGYVVISSQRVQFVDPSG